MEPTSSDALDFLPSPLPSPLDRVATFPAREFGSYVPHEPTSPRELRPGERPALQLCCYWGDTLLQVVQHAELQPLLMGPTSRCAVKAGARERSLIEPVDGGFGLSVEEGARAFLRRGGQIVQLDSGVHPLEPTDLAWIELGGLRVEASFAARPRPARAPLAASIDFRLVNLVLALSFVAALFAISAQFRSQDDLVADDLGQLNRVVAQVVRPIERAKLRTDALPSLDSSEPGAPVAAHSGPEGAAGDPTVKHKRPAVGAIGKVRFDTTELVAHTGMLAGLSGGPSTASLFGTGGLQGDVRAALGNLTGPTTGAAFGLGGLGQRGGGFGGGGNARTYGIGGIQTVGRAGGNDLFGTGHGLGPKDGTKIKFDDTPPETGGTLDPELVRQVIRAHVSHIRFCYEQRLESAPGLTGKVRIRFLVNGQGLVPQATVAEGSTLNDPELSACLLSRFKSWQFPSPKGGGSALVTYPVWLRPSGE